jgi:hypothetical protein
MYKFFVLLSIYYYSCKINIFVVQTNYMHSTIYFVNYIIFYIYKF